MFTNKPSIFSKDYLVIIVSASKRIILWKLDWNEKRKKGDLFRILNTLSFFLKE